VTQTEAEALAKNLFGAQGWAEHRDVFLLWGAYGVGDGARVLATGVSYEEAFDCAKRRLQRERERPAVKP
jgi:hypothetical protein